MSSSCEPNPWRPTRCWALPSRKWKSRLTKPWASMMTTLVNYLPTMIRSKLTHVVSQRCLSSPTWRQNNRNGKRVLHDVTSPIAQALCKITPNGLWP